MELIYVVGLVALWLIGWIMVVTWFKERQWSLRALLAIGYSWAYLCAYVLLLTEPRIASMAFRLIASGLLCLFPFHLVYSNVLEAWLARPASPDEPRFVDRERRRRGLARADYFARSDRRLDI